MDYSIYLLPPFLVSCQVLISIYIAPCRVGTRIETAEEYVDGD